jgi:hypothetical protein
VIGIFILGIGGLVIWNVVNNQVYAEKVETKSITKVVHNNTEEQIDLAYGSLSDAIHNTYIFLNFYFENGQLKNVNSLGNKETLDTLIKYEKGAIEWANKVNAAPEIKNTLNNVFIQTKEAIANNDYDSLKSVNQSLENLDTSYNIK